MEEKVKPSVAHQGYGGQVHERLLFSRASSFWIASIFDNRQLEVERDLQLIYEIGGERSPP